MATFTLVISPKKLFWKEEEEEKKEEKKEEEEEEEEKKEEEEEENEKENILCIGYMSQKIHLLPEDFQFSIIKPEKKSIKLVKKKNTKKQKSRRPKKLRGYARQELVNERKKWKKRAYTAAKDCIFNNIVCSFSEKPGLATIKQIINIEDQLWLCFRKIFIR